MDNLFDIFRELAQGTGLLGKFIYKMQVSWNGLEELKHTNYILRSLPNGVKIPEDSVCQGIPQNHGPERDS